MLHVKVHDSTEILNNYGLFGSVAGESLFSLKSLGLQVASQQTPAGTMSFGYTRPNWRCLVIMLGTTFGENHCILAQCFLKNK